MDTMKPVPMTAQASVIDAAEYILSLSARDGEPSIRPAKLHQLLYLSQGWHLGITGQPLFPEEIHAWAEGPVVPALVELHRGIYDLTPGFFFEQRRRRDAGLCIHSAHSCFVDAAGKCCSSCDHEPDRKMAARFAEQHGRDTAFALEVLEVYVAEGSDAALVRWETKYPGPMDFFYSLLGASIRERPLPTPGTPGTQDPDNEG